MFLHEFMHVSNSRSKDNSDLNLEIPFDNNTNERLSDNIENLL
jgi:hypothetical protein